MRSATRAALLVAVVEHQREPAALVLLAGDPLLELADALAFLLAALALPPLERRLGGQRGHLSR